MPKEIIYDRWRDDTKDPVTSDAYVRVGWSKDGSEHVQLATAVTAESKRVRIQFFDEESKGWHDYDPIEDNGLFVQLDRHGINRLIRTLRKARDDAFGSDA